MRNLSQRIPDNNIELVYFREANWELEGVTKKLLKCMETRLETLTPSEKSSLDSLVSWYWVCFQKEDDLYGLKHPAWHYCNLNTGSNLLILAAIPCEGAVASGSFTVGSAWEPTTLKFD